MTLPRRVDVAELDYENASAGAMLGYLEQFHDAGEAGLPSKVGSYLRKRNLEDLGHHDCARREDIATADLYVGSLPQPNRGGNLASANWIPEASKELHARIKAGEQRRPPLRPS